MTTPDLSKMKIEPGTPLHCVGCGKVVYRAPDHPALIAISCNCGAYSPILATAELLDAAEPVASTVPASVYGIIAGRRMGLKQAGHWENHLGPEPKTAAGRAWKVFLIECGLTSMADCGQERCQRAVERMKGKHESLRD